MLYLKPEKGMNLTCSLGYDEDQFGGIYQSMNIKVVGGCCKPYKLSCRDKLSSHPFLSSM